MRRKAKATNRLGSSAGNGSWLWVPVGIFLLGIGLYFNTLGHGFVFDDVTLILQNPSVVNLRWTDITGITSYRPIRTLSYALNYAIGGEDPLGFHLFNVILHAVNAVLVCRFLRLLSGSQLLASLGGLLFAVHPVQTAAVAYISGRKDLLAALFILVGCSLYVSFRSSPERRWLAIGAFGSFALAVLSKEVAVVIPLLVLSIDSYLEHGKGRHGGGAPPSFWKCSLRAIRGHPLLYGGFLAASVLAGIWVVFIVEASRKVGFWGGTFEANIGTGLKLFAHYLRMLVFPYPLIADYTGDVLAVSRGFAEIATLLSLVLLVGYALAILKLFPGSPLAAAGLLWILITLLPVLQILPFHELAADHFLYVPMVGFAAAVSVGASRLLTRARWRVPVIVGLAALGLLCAVATIDRNRDWKDNRTLWEATIRKAPGSFRANSNLGQIYFQEGRRQEGMKLEQRSLEMDPENPISWGNLGVMYYVDGQEARRSGNLDGAEELLSRAGEHFGKAVELDPEDPFAHSNLGNVYKEQALVLDELGQEDRALELRLKAVEQYRIALDTRDQRREVQAIWMNFAGLMIDAGYCDQAPYYLGCFLNAYPTDARGNYWMGYCLSEQGRTTEAIEFLEKAVASGPSPDALTLLAQAYEARGETSKAITAYRQILLLAPGSVEARYNLGILYFRSGNKESAKNYLSEALRLSPTGDLAAKISRALRQLD